MLHFAENIKKALSKDLPGEISHRKMLPPNRILKAASEENQKIKYSSVLLLLFVEKDELFACLIKRPSHMKHHAGQIALPGGRIEKGETALETAFRETEEEIGIKEKDIEILGQLSDFYVEVSHFQIQPFVGWLNSKPSFSINKEEVEKTILFPLLKSWKIESILLNTLTGELEVPCVKFENEVIWGATAMILSEMYDILSQIAFTRQ